MAISPGVRLGAYEVLGPLGQGGMGEVYRARDTRLGRVVAIKIVPPELASDAESRQHLRSEAHAISSLNHPNICALYDLGSDNGFDYLVMELLQGETLAARLRSGPLSFDEVLRLAIDVSQALDAAHAQGVVHRDVKPSNVMLTRTGAKLLDFGIAQVRGAAGAGALETGTIDEARPADGVVLGTLQYMAPEQLEGKDVDLRADIFSLGAVLYEAASGRRAFDGSSRAAVIAAVVERMPPLLGDVVPTLPPAFDRMVRRCLAKDPEERWQSSRDVLFHLREMAAGERRGPARTAARTWGWSAGALVAAGIVVAAFLPSDETASGATASTFHLALPPGVTIPPAEAVNNLAVSPDGRQIAFTASRDGRNSLFVRPIDSLDARALPDTEDARVPFWSPDSRFLGFVSSGKLQRIDPSGGPPMVICEAPVETAPTWGRDGTILFALMPNAAAKRSGGIYRVEATGGPIAQVTTIDRANGESEHYWASFLPDGQHFLYSVTVFHPETGSRSRVAYVASTADAVTTRVGDVESRLVFAPPNYLVYAHEGTLQARRFDLRQHRFIGDPVTVADRLWYFKPTGMAQFAVSQTGLLVYHGGLPVTELTWFDRSGRQIATMGSREAFGEVRISRDGEKVAVSTADPKSGSPDIWIFDRESGISTRSIRDPVEASWPVWSADGTTMFFRSTGASGPPDIYQKPSDGRGGKEVTVALDGVQLPLDVTPDGRTLVYLDANRTSGRDLWLLPLAGARTPTPYLRTVAIEHDARVSPDGRWLAFVSSESGRGEVYVAPIDDAGGRQRISIAGGLAPRWRRDGRELVYLDLNDMLMSVALTTGGRLQVSPPRALFSPGRMQRNPGGGLGEPYYDLAPDGQSFLVNRLIADPAAAPITVILNWTAALRN